MQGGTLYKVAQEANHDPEDDDWIVLADSESEWRLEGKSPRWSELYSFDDAHIAEVFFFA